MERRMQNKTKRRPCQKLSRGFCHACLPGREGPSVHVRDGQTHTISPRSVHPTRNRVRGVLSAFMGPGRGPGEGFRARVEAERGR